MENDLRRHITDRIHLGEMKEHKELAVVPFLCSVNLSSWYSGLNARRVTVR